MTLVPGDPASLSACAVTVAAVARRLREGAAAAGPALADLGEGWGGRSSVALRRRGDSLVGAIATTADRLDDLGRVLQDHATDLAGLLARARALEERAMAAGLEVRDGRVLPPWGVLAEADAGTDRSRREAAAALQAELDLVLSQHRRRRDFVLRTLRASGETLAEVSHALRRG
ncbi:hypothetical protein [Phycicoccus duodecadis]|uniref:Uncharacterized protein n=1 Tax=Phycicoccus duodecadis TaxID=173053 RepID=A0A2N3YJW6_9MICO|nr:hypothetical protein [Phycicoccus duodecadis]PKW27146.1 hypothetical protein ATL31_1982 [Phycicoccus duodecadis]